ncbi:MAG: Mur ligase family protein, partial [Candidatus Omnitrophica bacterium]|nr:Mur ligase family protein [Candidatus Omnitrophota bacterium]
LGAKVSVTDAQDNEVTRRNCAKLISEEIKIELGKHSRAFIEGRDLVVVSPGVPPASEAMIFSRELNIAVVSEIEVASMLCPGTIIAVTGSNGKTTVTTLVGKILEAAGKKVFTCGNIGNPFSGEVSKIKEGDFVSLEVSSFQLENIRDFKPKISLILNFSRNHLDRYKDMQEYLEAKKRIYLNQDKNDYLILNSDCPVSQALAQEARGNIVYFSKTEGLNPNQAAVVAVGVILGVTKETCLKVFKQFNGVEHRMEYVAEISGIKFINDSKATTVDSAVWALESIAGQVVLIAGGKDKGLDYKVVLDSARNKVREVILIGEAKEKIKAALKGALLISEAGSLDGAIGLAFNKAKPGDSVLLSPMCSSFDMFSDYEARGRAFKKAVLELKAKKE